MEYKNAKSERIKLGFTLSTLSVQIVDAAINGPVPGKYAERNEIVRDAVYEWGLVHMHRERGGGLRLIDPKDFPAPFGENRERKLLSRRSGSGSAKNWTRATATMTPLCDEILKTAVEDVRGKILFRSKSEVIDLALMQWALSHFELEYTESGWTLSYPLRLRSDFDFDGTDISLSTASLEEVSAKPDFFGAEPDRRDFEAGTVAVPFYRPMADSYYLSERSGGSFVPDSKPVMVESVADESEYFDELDADLAGIDW